MITVGTYFNIAKAQLDKTRLEDSHVPAFIADEAMSTIGYGPAMIGGARLQVCDEDAERARAILAEPAGLPLPDNAEFESGGAERESLRCMSRAERRAFYRQIWRSISRALRRIRSE